MSHPVIPNSHMTGVHVSFTISHFHWYIDFVTPAAEKSKSALLKFSCLSEI